MFKFLQIILYFIIKKYILFEYSRILSNVSNNTYDDTLYFFKLFQLLIKLYILF